MSWQERVSAFSVALGLLTWRQRAKIHVTDPSEIIGCRLLGGLCCKSRFAQVIKNSAGCRRVFRVKT